MDHLLRMQLAYDVAKVREHSREIAVEAPSAQPFSGRGVILK